MAPSSAAQHITASLDVLIIEDDELASQQLEQLFDQAGIGSLSVSTLRDAREAMKAVYFPVIVLDRKLDDGDGIELCREYRARHAEANVYILVLSSLDSDDDVQAGIAAGADDYVSKRASSSDLIERVRRGLAAAQR